MSTKTNQPEKIEQTKNAHQPRDVYDLFQNSLDKYFKEVKHNTATYLQTVSDLQEEIIDSRRKNVEQTIDLQKTAYAKFGGKNNISPASLDMVKTLSENTMTAWNLQNKLVLESLQILSKNIEAFNQNSTSFEETNKKLIDFWATVIKQAVKTGKTQ